MPIDPSESVSVTETENFEQQVFTRITVGDVACGVSGMFVVCEDKTYELDSPILDIQASSLFDFLTCALLASGKILCLGDPPQLLESTDKYTMLSVSDTGLCALSERGVIHCTGAEPGGGPFIAVSAGNGYSCGITASGELVCFSETEVDSGGSARIYFDAPEGKFKAVSVSKHLVRAACAINEGLGAVCWTPQVAPEQGYRFFPPEGEFTDLTVGFSSACGLLVGGDVQCWPLVRNESEGTISTPVSGISGSLSVSASGDRYCALDESSRPTCWHVP